METSGFNDKTWLDFRGHPHTEALKITERFRRQDFGHMRLDMTFEDPGAYRKPWTITMMVALVPDMELLESVCLENEKDYARLVGKVADEKKAEKQIPAGMMASYVGSYDLGPLGSWKVSVSANQLMIEMADGGGPLPAFAQSDTVFVFPALGGTVTFVKDGKGDVTRFVLTIVEGDFDATREK